MSKANMNMKSKSDVWDNFTKVPGGFAKCNICKKIYKTSGNTSNLKDHLKRVHNFHRINKDIDQSFHEIPEQGNVKYFLKRKVEYEANNEKKIKLDKLIAMMIATDLQPYSIVEDKGFCQLIAELDPKYKLPSTTTLRNKLIPDIFNHIFAKLKTVLSNVESVSLTTDLWTSMVSESYITVTCHFMNGATLKSAVLETVGLVGQHTAVNIKNHLEDLIKKWSLEGKVTAIVTDNASNMINACNLLQIKHVACFAHTLNLCVNDVINRNNKSKTDNQSENEIIIKLLEKCRNIVKYFKKSVYAMETLLIEQRKKNMVPLKPKQDVATRWNSSLIMIERLIQLNTDDCLAVTLSKLPGAPSILSFDDVSILKELITILKPFETATNEISGENYVTISLIIPLVMGIYTNLGESYSKLETEVVKKTCIMLQNSVTKRLFTYETRTIPRAATLLDPRFKKFAFRQVENAEQARIFVQQELARLMEQREIHFERNEHESKIETEHDEAGVNSNNTQSSNLFSFLEKKISNASKISTVTSDSIITVRQYMETPAVSMSQNPLNYWEECSSKQLSRLAKRYLSLPATSVPSERVFSKSGEIISKKRSNLKDNNVNKLVFIKSNQWLLEKEA